jgi:hypothetical protein
MSDTKALRVAGLTPYTARRVKEYMRRSGSERAGVMDLAVSLFLMEYEQYLRPLPTKTLQVTP